MNESGDLPVFPRLPQPRPPPGVSASLPGHIAICPSPIPKDYHRPLPENYLPEPEAGTAADAPGPEQGLATLLTLNRLASANHVKCLVESGLRRLVHAHIVLSHELLHGRHELVVAELLEGGLTLPDVHDMHPVHVAVATWTMKPSGGLS